MSSLIYDGFERIIKLYQYDAVTPLTSVVVSGITYFLPNSGDISSICVGCDFSYSAERGCTSGEIRIIGCLPDGSNADDFTNPYWIADNTVVKIFCKSTDTDPIWTGVVTGASKQVSNSNDDYIHTYLLDGLSVRLMGYPSTAFNYGDQKYNDVEFFGTLAATHTEVPAEQRHDDYYYICSNAYGLVNWLCLYCIQNVPGILAASNNWDLDYTGQRNNNSTKLPNFQTSTSSDIANTLQDLARMNYDYIRAEDAQDLNPSPAFWGVNHLREFYYKYRPNVDLVRFIQWSPTTPSLKPILMIGSTEVQYENYRNESFSA